MILKYENSEENYKTSYICVFFFSITQYIQILLLLLLNFGKICQTIQFPKYFNQIARVQTYTVSWTLFGS